MSPRLNITECQGVYAAFQVPGPQAQKFLPPAYKLRSPTGTSSIMLLYVHECKKVAVDGLDVGPFSWSYVTLDVADPPGPPPLTGVLSRFMLEGRTNQSVMAGWLSGRGWRIDGGVTNVTTSVVLPPQYLAETVAEVRNGTSHAYAFHGYPYASLLPRSRVERFFFGPNPATDYFTHHYNVRASSGEGPGNVTMAPETAVSRVLFGAPMWVATLGNFNMATAVLEPPPLT